MPGNICRNKDPFTNGCHLPRINRKKRCTVLRNALYIWLPQKTGCAVFSRTECSRTSLFAHWIMYLCLRLFCSKLISSFRDMTSYYREPFISACQPSRCLSLMKLVAEEQKMESAKTSLSLHSHLEINYYTQRWDWSYAGTVPEGQSFCNIASRELFWLMTGFHLKLLPPKSLKTWR